MEQAHKAISPEMDPNKPIIMFSGQGSQKPGMGESLMGRPIVDETMSCASDIFGFDVAQLMLEGPAKTLDDTRCAQAAIVSLSVALYQELQVEGVEAAAMLGFSLGQVSAAYASGMLSMEECFSFAKIRSELMADAAAQTKGKMCALLGIDEKQAQEICDECAREEILVIANYNCPGQIVVSGHEAAVVRAQEAWSIQKGRSAMLSTSGAFHSPLMSGAADLLDDYLKTQIFKTPHTPLISNLDACVMNAEVAREHFVQHLTHPVRFQQSLEGLDASGAHEFVELGYGGVLIGLVKRINRKSERVMLDSAQTFDEFISLHKNKGKQ